MKRYYAFVCAVYYPGGGMEDFRGDYDTLEEASKSIHDIALEEGSNLDYFWKFHFAEIFDSVTRNRINYDSKNA